MTQSVSKWTTEKEEIRKRSSGYGGIRRRRQAVGFDRAIQQNSLDNVRSEQKLKEKLAMQTSWEEPSSRHLPGRGTAYTNQ